MKLMRHIGYNKNTGGRYIVASMQLPDTPDYCLVVEVDPLPTIYSDSLNDLVKSDIGQKSSELLNVMARNQFSDGLPMHEALHRKGYLKKVKTDLVYMTPTPNHRILLSELNESMKNDNTPDIIQDKTELTVNEINAAMAKHNVIAEEVNQNTQIIKNIIIQAELCMQEVRRYVLKAAEADKKLSFERTLANVINKYVNDVLNVSPKEDNVLHEDNTTELSSIKEEKKPRKTESGKPKRKYTRRVAK